MKPEFSSVPLEAVLLFIITKNAGVFTKESVLREGSTRNIHKFVMDDLTYNIV